MRELLLLLCKYPYKQKNHALLSKLLSDVKDWPKLVKLINSHGIIALAAYNIKESGLVKEVPPDAMASLENGYKQSMVRNLWLVERWKEVNRILTDAGIKHVLLKGMALEHTLYGSKGLRQMTDNDILIKKEQAIEAWNILRQHGYMPQIIKSGLHKKIMFGIGEHLPALYKDGYAVEIHYRLPEKDINPESDPIDRAVEFLIGNSKAFMLMESDHLEFLVYHFMKHAKYGIMKFRLYTDILLLDPTCKINMPDEFVSDPIQETKQKYLKIAFKDSFRSIPSKYRLRYLLGDIFPSIEWMKRRYTCGPAKALLYYPHRIGKLLWLI